MISASFLAPRRTERSQGKYRTTSQQVSTARSNILRTKTDWRLQFTACGRKSPWICISRRTCVPKCSYLYCRGPTQECWLAHRHCKARHLIKSRLDYPHKITVAHSDDAWLPDWSSLDLIQSMPSP